MTSRRRFAFVTTVVTALATAVTGVVVAASPAAEAVTKRPYDISWPQCQPGGLPLPPVNGTSLVIIGLTNGLAFTENSCLGDQHKWAVDNAIPAQAYAMATYPTAAQLTTYGGSGPWTGTEDAARLRNVGYAEGQAAVASLKKYSWKPPMVWVDVEPRPKQNWPKPTTRGLMLRNRFVIEGLLRGLEASGYPVGIYSNNGMWNDIVGPWWLPGIPTWVPTGAASDGGASPFCTKPSFSGGKVFMVQWTDQTYDFDITCAPWTFTPAKPPAPSDANDVNGDWKNDLIARQSSNSTVWLYKGNGATSGNRFQPRVSTGTLSTSTYNFIETAGDLTGDGRVDLLARTTGGTLYLFPGKGSSWGPRRSLGTGWGGMKAITGIGDWTGDGRPDLVALQTSNGVLYLYPGTGSGGLRTRTALKSGLSGMDKVVGVGDMTLNGIPDVVMREAATGTLWFYPGFASGAFGPRIRIGSGWNTMSLFAGVGDFTGNGVPDLIVREKVANGADLFLYPGSTDGTLKARIKIGTDWRSIGQIA